MVFVGCWLRFLNLVRKEIRMKLLRMKVLVGLFLVLGLISLVGCAGISTRTAMGQSHWTVFDEAGRLEHRNDGTAEVTISAQVDEAGTWTYSLHSIPSKDAAATLQAGWSEQAKVIGKIVDVVDRLAGGASVAGGP